MPAPTPLPPPQLVAGTKHSTAVRHTNDAVRRPERIDASPLAVALAGGKAASRPANDAPANSPEMDLDKRPLGEDGLTRLDLS